MNTHNAHPDDHRALRNLAFTLFAFVVVATGLVGLSVVLGNLS